MIHFTLKCDRNHRFDSWFKSGEGYEKLRTDGLLLCPDCGSARIEKAPMAPSVVPQKSADVSSTSDRAASGLAAEGGALSAPRDPREAALAELKRQIEANSEYVGMNFVAEARRIHEGLAPERSIYGEAKADEARRLIEDGVQVAPLPFRPKGRVN